ncbi:MAG: SDR family oxidoreductase [Lautropia sp.]
MNHPPSARTVLVVGASGLIGTAVVDVFLDAGWQVIAVSRRKPEVFSSRAFEHLPVDLQDERACAESFGKLASVTHVVYTAVYEKPGLIAGWSDPEQMETNLRMLRNVVEPLAKAARLEHLTLLQGTKAYGIRPTVVGDAVRVSAMRVPARERHPRVEHANFYWLQEDYIKAKSAEAGFEWTIFRPTIVIGPNVGVAMNTIPVIGIYAALCREEGVSFAYPGHLSFVREAVDVRLIGRAALWATQTAAARGEHFNLTNGEVFSWRDLWPSLAEFFGLEQGPDRPTKMAEYLPSRSGLWDRIVQKHGLRKLTMTQLLGESHHSADLRFGYGLTQLPPPIFVSTVKIKQAGFTDTYDTELAVKHWLGVLIDRKILPPRANV